MDICNRFYPLVFIFVLFIFPGNLKLEVQTSVKFCTSLAPTKRISFLFIFVTKSDFLNTISSQMAMMAISSIFQAANHLLKLSIFSQE